MIVVTGATGLLGSFIVRRLTKENLSVVGIKRKESNVGLLAGMKNISWREADITDPVSLSEAFAGAKVVIHAAASVSFNPRKADQIFDVNVKGTKNVVDACLLNGVEKLVHISSVAALGRQKGITLLDENTKWSESPLNTFYAKSKALAELEVYRGIEEGLSAAIVNPSFILAPSDWEKSSSKIFNYVWNEKLFYSNGLVNYVDVEDVAEMVFQLIDQNFSGERFIASGGSVTYKELFDQIAQRFGKKSPSIKAHNYFLLLLARLEELRCYFRGQEPLISRESIKTAGQDFTYSNKKGIDLLKMRFKPLSETLDTCCEHYLRTYSTKK